MAMDKIIRIEKHGKYWVGACELYGLEWVSCSRFKFFSRIQMQYTLGKVEKFYQYWKSYGYVSLSEKEPEEGQEIAYVNFKPPYLSHFLMAVINEHPQVNQNAKCEYNKKGRSQIKLWAPSHLWVY